MSILYFLIGCSVILATIFLGAFFWAQRTGQNDDLYTPSIRMLMDDDNTSPIITDKDAPNIEK